METIIRAPRGAERHEERLDSIEVPDLWHIAMRLKGQDREMVLSCWHLCHDLLANLRGNTAPFVKS